MTKPKIAVFGAGLVGARHVAEAARQAELCAIVDPSDAAQALAGQHAVPWFDDPAACLAEVKPDGVVIATPNHLHGDHAVLCLEAGIPVLIEKPIADTLANADRIVAASEAADVPVLVGHHRRHNPIIQRAKAIVEAGELGDVVAVTGQFWLYKPDDYFEATWRKAPGAGPMLINCIHDVDLMRYLCGEITAVQAMRSNVRRGNDVEDTAAVIMRFGSGALGTFAVSDTVVAPWSWEMTTGENPIYPHLNESCYRIGGTQKSLSIPDLTLWSHIGERSWWSEMTQSVAAVDRADAFVVQFSHFCDVIGGASPLVSAQEGRESLRSVLLMIESGNL